MIYGEIVQRWRESRGARLLKWPRDALERWGGWFLFGLFAAILVWCGTQLVTKNGWWWRWTAMLRRWGIPAGGDEAWPVVVLMAMAA